MNLKRVLVLTVFGASLLGAQNKSRPAVSTEGSQAQRWEGRLIDAARSDCGVEAAGAAPGGLCPVSVTTAHFGLLTADGKMVRFDEGGNPKAMDALKKSKKASKLVTDFWRSGKALHQIRATVAGTLTGDTLNVESIRIN